MTKLQEAAQAVIDRWDTPLWKDVPATAGYINALRDALASTETCTWTSLEDMDTPDTYQTECGEMWSFVDGSPAENHVRFCHKCGKNIEAKR